MDFTKFIWDVYGTQEANWGHIKRSIVEELALVHSEVSEAVEDVRDDHFHLEYEGEKPVGLPSELADIIIRTVNIATKNGIDIEEALLVKAAYNKTRPIAHGGKKL